MTGEICERFNLKVLCANIENSVPKRALGEKRVGRGGYTLGSRRYKDHR